MALSRGRTALLFSILASAAGCGDDGDTTPPNEDSSSAGTTATTGTPSGSSGGGPGATGTGGAGTGGEGAGGEGTGAGNVTNDLVASGSRLTARGWSVGDGAALSNDTWFDTEREETCTILPTGADTAICASYEASIYYLDEDCTEPVIVRNLGCYDHPVVAAASVNLPCEPYALTFVKSTDETLEGVEVFGASYGEDGLDCYAAGEFDVFVAEPIAGDDFVTFVREDVEIDDAILRTDWVGSDGSRAAASTIDRERDEVCATFGDPDRCVPLNQASGPYYGDGSCEDRAGIYFGCGVPAVVVDNGADDCEAPSYFEVGDPIATGYEMAEGVCQEIFTSGDFYAHGAPLAADALPSLDVVEIGTGRVRGRFHARAGTAVETYTKSLYDTELETVCYPGVIEGTPRCLPVGESEVYYTDADCTTPVFAPFDAPGDRCGGYAPFAVRAQYEDAACNYDTYPEEIFAVGDEVDDVTFLYIIGTDGECYPDGEPDNGVYELTPLSPTDFPEIEEVDI